MELCQEGFNHPVEWNYMTSNDQTYQNILSAVFRDKPELIISLPDWMLSEKQADAYRNLKNLAIVEIAGRDSVAAAVKSVGDNGFTDLLPVYVYTGTEFGAWDHVEQAANRLSRRLPGTKIHPLLVMGSPKFWRALNGRFVSELVRRYGFYSPCPGCHLYLHSARIPLAVKLGNIPIISGERESHAGMVKINQTAVALDFYLAFAAHFGVRFLFPLRHIAGGDEIERIIQIPWKGGKDQLNCAFSENYQMMDTEKTISSDVVRCFFEKFAGPTAQAIIAAYLLNYVPDHNAIAERILKCLP
jgi:hypothetical protein